MKKKDRVEARNDLVILVLRILSQVNEIIWCWLGGHGGPTVR